MCKHCLVCLVLACLPTSVLGLPAYLPARSACWLAYARACLPANLCARPVCLPACQICMLTCLCVCLPTCQPLCPACLLTCLPHLPAGLPVCLFACMPAKLWQIRLCRALFKHFSTTICDFLRCFKRFQHLTTLSFSKPFKSCSTSLAMP